MVQSTDMVDQDDIQVFEDARPNLLGLAYRILGTMILVGHAHCQLTLQESVHIQMAAIL